MKQKQNAYHKSSYGSNVGRLIRMAEKLAIVAIGGNALSQPKESPTAQNMLKNLENTAKC